MNIKISVPHTVSAWLFIFSCLPALFLLALSFMTSDLKLIAGFPLTLQHYYDLLSPLFLKIAWRSFWMASLTTLICLVLAYPFSFFLLRIRYKPLIIILIIIPFWTSSLVRTFDFWLMST